MLVAPLVTFLSDAVADHDEPVEAQSSDDWFGDAATGRDLSYARLMAQGVDDVGRSRSSQLVGCDNALGNRGVSLHCSAREPGHNNFVEHGIGLLHHKVSLRCLCEINLAQDSLMTEIAHLQCQNASWQA